MKKILLTGSSVLIACFSLLAQKTKFGFTAGASFSNYHAKADGQSQSGNGNAGFTAGLLADVPLSEKLSFQPAFNFIQKGSKDEQTFGGVTEKTKLSTNHAELLLNILYNIQTNGGNFFIGAGPSASIAVSGKWKYSDATDSYKENVRFGNTTDDDLKPIDLGANLTTGFCFPNGLFIAVNYNQGLSNLYPGDSRGSKLTSHYFGIRLGFLLNNMK
jgi:Outer membrane protein beta-barrel domain